MSNNTRKNLEKVKGTQDGWEKKVALVTQESMIYPSSHLYTQDVDPHHVGPFENGTWS